MKNNLFMQIALEEARSAFDQNETPVGACIALNGEVIARAQNQMRQKKDPTAHAEIIVMNAARLALNQKRLNGCDLYITLEPCTMCAGAIALNHIRRLYYAASDEKMGNCQFFTSPLCHHTPQIYGGIAKQEAQNLMLKFFRRLRENSL